MKTLISKESGKTWEIKLEDRNGCCYLNDTLGNSGAFETGGLDIDDEGNITSETDQNASWWVRYIDGEQRQLKCEKVLREAGCHEIYDEAIKESGCSDLDYQSTIFQNMVLNALEDGELLGRLDTTEDLAGDAYNDIKEIWEGYESP